jgi:predicted PurR-regulated permease PerM
MVGRSLIIAALIALALWVMSLIPKTVEVFVIAILIAYGLAPIVRRLSLRMPRALAIAIVYVALVLVISAVFVVIVPAVLDQFQVMFGNAPAYVSEAQQFANGAQAWLKAHLGPLVATNQLQTIESSSVDKVSAGIEMVLGSLSSIAVGVANAVVIATFGVILSYFLLANSDAIRDSFYSLFPERAQKHARVFSREVGRVVGGFIIGQTILCVIAAVLTYLALLAIRTPYALLLAVLSGLCYAIPYIGVVIAAAVGFGLGALTSWKVGLVIAIIIMVASKIVDFLVPKVMGDTVGVSPMAIIFAVFAGGEVFGLWGVILAIPAAALFKVIWNLWLHPWLTGKPFEFKERSDEADAKRVPLAASAAASTAAAAPHS